uniref:Programmed cell death 2 n=1 Tax=Nothobranchius furzeri TaxID=105023 RepID=A0A1A8AT73_NOTFU
MAMHETEDNKTFQQFKKKTSSEPHQVMPQLLNSLSVDSTGASIDWGTLAIYTCTDSCNHDDRYYREFIWKQDFTSDQNAD